jgi:Tfp pilus assembly protein FimV
MFETGLDFEHVFVEHDAMQRTYVRRRLVALAAAVAVVVAVSGPVARALAIADRGLEPASSTTYVVRTGDSLWSIARAIAPDRDPRAVILDLERDNGGSLGTLVPGQVLAVPRS